MSESQEQPNKTGIDKFLLKPKKGISKKQLATRLIASAAIASTIGLKGDAIGRSLGEESVVTPTGVIRELSIQDLEERAEQMYQIRFVSPKELPEIEYENTNVKTAEWTKEDISNLTRSLDKLPPHFYSPTHSIYRIELPRFKAKSEFKSNDLFESENQSLYNFALNRIFREDLGKDFFISREDYNKARERGYFARELKAFPVEFVVVPNLEPDKKWHETRHWGVCFCSSENENPKVIISSSRFKKSEQSLLSDVAHELTHRITKPDDEKFVSELLQPPQGVTMKKFLTPDLLRIFPDLALRLSLKDTIYTMDRLNYGSQNIREFLAVGSEFYLQGEERFQEVYGVFIGEEKAGMLYNYTRDNIFEGTKYKDYQKVNE